MQGDCCDFSLSIKNCLSPVEIQAEAVSDAFSQPGAARKIWRNENGQWTDGRAVLQSVSSALSWEELLALLHSEEVRNYPWIADENQRRLRFRELISSGDREALMGMIGALLRHKKAQLAAGRKFHQADENFLTDAQKLLNAEFAQVFSLEPKDINAFIQKELENTH